MKKNKGVLYCATGNNQYINQAFLSASSIKKHNLEISCSICTDNVNEAESQKIWDNIIKIEKSNVEHEQYMLDKLITLSKTPYEQTLYLDSDTYILDDISELFNLLNRFDLAICHGHNRKKRYDIQYGILEHRGAKRKVAMDSIPYSFSPVQGGLLLYNYGKDKVREWIADLLILYQKKRFFDDQVSMRELLWNSDLNFYILPPEYNFNSIQDIKRWRRNGYIEAIPKIFHYTKHKNKNIERLIKRYL